MGGKEHEQGPEKKRRNTYSAKVCVHTHKCFSKMHHKVQQLHKESRGPKRILWPGARHCGFRRLPRHAQPYFFWCFCIHTWKVSTRMASYSVESWENCGGAETSFWLGQNEHGQNGSMFWHFRCVFCPIVSTTPCSKLSRRTKQRLEWRWSVPKPVFHLKAAHA